MKLEMLENPNEEQEVFVYVCNSLMDAILSKMERPFYFRVQTNIYFMSITGHISIVSLFNSGAFVARSMPNE